MHKGLADANRFSQILDLVGFIIRVKAGTGADRGEGVPVPEPLGRTLDSLKPNALFAKNPSTGGYTMHFPNMALITLTVGDRYASMVEPAVRSKSGYCQKWDYPFINETRRLNESRPIAWSKIDLILRELPNYEYVVWVDADAFIMNQELPLEVFLLLLSDRQHMIIGEDLNCLNAGVLIIRRDQSMFRLLTEINATSLYDNHGWWEQRALIQLYWQHVDSIRVVPHRWCHLINAFSPKVDPKYPYRPGDWCFHLAGFRDPDLISRVMGELEELSKKDKACHRLPVELLRLLRRGLPWDDLPLIPERDFWGAPLYLVERERSSSHGNGHGGTAVETIGAVSPRDAVGVPPLTPLTEDGVMGGDVKAPLMEIEFGLGVTGFPRWIRALAPLMNYSDNWLTIDEQVVLFSVGATSNIVMQIGFGNGLISLLLLTSRSNSKLIICDGVMNNESMCELDHLRSVFPERVTFRDSIPSDVFPDAICLTRWQPSTEYIRMAPKYIAICVRGIGNDAGIEAVMQDLYLDRTVGEVHLSANLRIVSPVDTYTDPKGGK